MGREPGTKRPRILYTTPVLRHPPRSGPQLRVENSIKALSRIADVYLFPRVMENDAGGPAATYFFEACSREVRFAPFTDSRQASILHRIRDRAGQRLGLLPDYPIGRESERDYRALLRWVDRIGADIIWLGYGNLSYALLHFLKSHSDYPVVVDTDSVWSRYLCRGVPYIDSEEERARVTEEAAEKEVEERRGAAVADVTTAVSAVDAAIYRDWAGSPDRVCLFGNAIDLETYAPVPPPPAGMHHPSVYLAGTFWAGSPMEHAARWLIEDVFPRIRRRHSDAHLYILGKGSKETLSTEAGSGVEVLGEVESVLPWLCHAGVVTVPLHFESGTRFKILEAGACRKAVVSTTLGAEGLNVTHGTDMLIADTAEDFAREIAGLIENPDFGTRLGDRLRALVESAYDLAALAREGQAVIDRILPR